MPRVIERISSAAVDGRITYDERPDTYARADKLAGRRLDRRKNYAIIGGEVCEACSWSDACSGCHEGERDGLYARGMGCHECGYAGRRIQSTWVPVAKEPKNGEG